MKISISRMLLSSLLAAILLAGCSDNTIGPNHPPRAVAGPDGNLDVNTPATLDGSASFDPDGDDLDFSWSILVAPPGAQATIAAVEEETTTLRPDVAGTWLIGLVVTDSRGLSSRPDVVRLEVRSTTCTSDADCDDGIACTVDRCRTDTGRCDFTPDDSRCADDGVFCNGAEVCTPGVGCTSSGDPCLDEPGACDEENDICGGCGDGVIANGEDCDPAAPAGSHCCNPATCRWTLAGEADPQGTCSGAPECQLDVCDGAGNCTFANAPEGSSCGDPGSSDCDRPDSCLGGSCQANREPPATVCRPAAGECDVAEHCDGVNPDCPPDEFAPPGTQCTDLSADDCRDAQCDGAGNCDQAHAFEPDGSDCAGDGVGCTRDECQGGTCRHLPDDGNCPPDGLFCNGVEYCDPASDCTSPGNPCLDPGDCDEDNDACRSCGDGLVSNGEDCDPAPPAGDNCCDPLTCRWTANGQPDPQAACTGAPVCHQDVCDGSGGCTTAFSAPGTACGDQTDDDCTDPDSCDGAGRCLPNNAPSGTACGNSSFCGGSGTCDDDGRCLAANLVAGDYCDGGQLVHCDGNGGETSRVNCALGCVDAAPSSRCRQVDPANVESNLLCAGTTALVIDAPATIDTSSGDIVYDAGGLIAHSDTIVSQPNPGRPIMVFSFTSIDIAADVSVIGTRPLALLSCGDISLDAVINACGRANLGGPGGRDGGASESDGIGYYSGYGRGGPGRNNNPWSCAGGGGGAFGGDGGQGGDGGSNYYGGAGGTSYGTAELEPLLGGSGGGGGGDWGGGSAGWGGGGGGAVQLTAGGALTIGPGSGITACGAGGGTNNDVEGIAGGGGGSGGGILLEGVTVTIDGIVAANGGGGGGGDGYEDSADATPGDDGYFGTSRAQGGSGTAGSYNDGGDGGRGGAADEPWGDPGEDMRKAGGGGGAAGRIRINTASGNVSGSFTLSPFPATGLTTFGIVDSI